MNGDLQNSQWIWHPQWIDHAENTAGAFVCFRKTIDVKTIPSQPVHIQITADTKYKLYINQELVAFGPVKGDERLWFYDEVDIQPYLKPGINYISVRVLRFYYATPYAASFARLPQAGLLIRNPASAEPAALLQTDRTWETAIDHSTRLPIDIAEDDFLHTYEEVIHSVGQNLQWTPARELAFPKSHGLTIPWQLSKRMIPPARLEKRQLMALHNLKSTQAEIEWTKILLSKGNTKNNLRLPRGSSHRIELEVEHHTTAFVHFRFARPETDGSKMTITYSEAYENTPFMTPYLRDKGDRRDTKRKLIGPYDVYNFAGKSQDDPGSGERVEDKEDAEETFSPFHFRTFRFMVLDIEVDSASDLVILGIDLTAVNYPLDVLADFNVTETRAASSSDQSTITTPPYRNLWNTSIRTLQNCMHDCYEDCPFYEQFQYAMDTRSSALFTYSISGDDRLARQAILQLQSSYNPVTGLTASRAPSHQPQIIPSFSLFWILLVTDHYTYFTDKSFTTRFLPECDGVLAAFARRVDPATGLIRALPTDSPHWDFVDWTHAWRPMGIPPAGARTGFLSLTSMLYAYTLQQLASVLLAMGNPHYKHRATEYSARAAEIITALRAHCFDGEFFTDGLAGPEHYEAEEEDKGGGDYSQHSQIWAVLCGAARGDLARSILTSALDINILTSSNKATPRTFTPTSLAMSFYTLRALSLAGRDLYAAHFRAFWSPWTEQLAQNLDTWCEDAVSQRSDCHAWGSVPCFEFVAEVAGVRPVGLEGQVQVKDGGEEEKAKGESEGGWCGGIAFEPRVELFERLDVRVPFGGKKGVEGAGVAWVRWRREGEKTRVLLSLEWHDGIARDVPIRVVAPDGVVEVKSGLKELEFWFS